MVEFEATLFDGRTSAVHCVLARGDAGNLHIAGDGIAMDVPMAQISVDPRIGNLRRRVSLPGGACLQTTDHAALAILFPRANRMESWVQRLERRWPYALGGLVLTALFTAWFVVYGLPIVANEVAEHVPTSVEDVLGERTLQTVDQQFCEPSKLPTAHQQALQTAFAVLRQGVDDGYGYHLQLRDCGRLGANAFALPGGNIVLTDALVKLSKNDLQVSAALAHEIGHVHQRHGLRLLLHGAGIAILTATLFGDAASITGLAVTLPTLLLQSGYSRDFETEADSYAFVRLKQVGQSPQQFAEIMRLLEANRSKSARNKDTDGEKDNDPEKYLPKAHSVLDYLATHPVTEERIQRAMANR